MALQVTHPYVGIENIHPLKGNLHAHTNESDGTMLPQAMIDAYARRGYDFLMVSDHDIYNSPERLAGYQANGMTLIPGNEITAHGPHLLHVNANCRVEPQRDRQAVLDEIGRSGGFAIMNHPNWEENFDHLPFSQLAALRGYAGVEIFNGVCQGLAGSAYATDKWDKLTGTGRRVWGFANDDLHGPDHIGRGWNMVYAASRSVADIVDAMSRGCFYASTGVNIIGIDVDGDTIRVRTDNADRIVALTQFGTRFRTVDAAEMKVQIPDHATMMRFECWGRGEAFAWTQPFFITH